MKKSLLLIKALIIVFWSAQVSLAESKFVEGVVAERIVNNGKLITSGYESKIHDGVRISFLASLYKYRSNYYRCTFTKAKNYDNFLTTCVHVKMEFYP